jgi:hypothetical protein
MMSNRWKDLVPEGFDLDAVMAQTTQSEATMRQRLKRCNFDVALALDDSYWASNMQRKRRNLTHWGRPLNLEQYATILGVSASLVCRWFKKGLSTDQVTRKVMYGEVGPRIYGQDRVEGPPDWSSMGDMGPRIKLESLGHLDPTVWDLQYGEGSRCKV